MNFGSSEGNLSNPEPLFFRLWTDRRGSVYYELRKQEQTIGTNIYRNQFYELNAVAVKAELCNAKKLNVLRFT